MNATQAAEAAAEEVRRLQRLRDSIPVGRRRTDTGDLHDLSRNRPSLILARRAKVRLGTACCGEAWRDAAWRDEPSFGEGTRRADGRTGVRLLGAHSGVVRRGQASFGQPVAWQARAGNGMAGCDTAWRAQEGPGRFRYGMPWYGRAWQGRSGSRGARNGVARQGRLRRRHGAAWSGWASPGMAWLKAASPGMAGTGEVRRAKAWRDEPRLAEVRPGEARQGNKGEAPTSAGAPTLRSVNHG